MVKKLGYSNSNQRAKRARRMDQVLAVTKVGARDGQVGVGTLAEHVFTQRLREAFNCLPETDGCTGEPRALLQRIREQIRISFILTGPVRNCR